MADPKNPSTGKPGNGTPKLPPGELGKKKSDPARELIKRASGGVSGNSRLDKEMQNWLSAMAGGESASRMKEDLAPTELMRGDDILDAIAADMGMEKVRLSEVQYTPALIAEVPPEVAKRYGVVPVKSTPDQIWLALSDPHNVAALDTLSLILGKHVVGMVALEDDINRVIHRHYETDDYKSIYDGMAENDEPDAYRKWDELDLDNQSLELEQPAVVKFVDLIFKQAVHERASDIHIEPSKSGVTIRFRIDGVLHEVPSPPRKWQNAIISRLKVLAGMDLAEKRIPLDGRISIKLGDRKLDLRVSTLPTIFGESIVMRILDPQSVMLGLEDVGFLPASVKMFNDLIRQPNGVILMTGPTGSGKTTTLYAALGTLNTPEHKLVTLEDPVEYQIPGINQIQINNEIGLGFAAGLKAVLRQSPDIILVGEIRDIETAENAIRAALTGHLVFSTLHTNDAPSATTRLIDMGIKPFLVASSLQAVIAQRLVRRICAGCKEAWRPPAEAIREMGYDPDEFQDTDFFRGHGCERCGQSGYRGRTAIHEIMVLDPELRRRVIRSEPATRIKKAALTKGMRSLRMDGWEKCLLGTTTLEEILRITQSDV